MLGGVREGGKRAVGWSKIGVSGLQARLPGEDIRDEWERIGGGLQAHKESAQRGSRLGHFSAGMQQQEPQKFYPHARIFFRVGETASVSVERRLAGQLLCRFQLIPLIGKSDQSIGGLCAKNTFSPFICPMSLFERLLV